MLKCRNCPAESSLYFVHLQVSWFLSERPLNANIDMMLYNWTKTQQIVEFACTQFFWVRNYASLIFH